MTVTALALALSGVAAFAIERARVDNEMASELVRRGQAFLTVASEPDPVTNLPYASASDLMREGMRRIVASPTTSAVAHVNGRPRFVPADPQRLALEDDAAFMEIATATASLEIHVLDAYTPNAEYHYVSIPLVDDSGTILGVFTIATDRGARMGDITETFRVYTLVATFALLLIGFVGWVTVSRLLRPVRLLDDAARQISESDLSQRIPIVGNDDLARLSETVNAMLDRLEQAFEAQRQLLDDAGHELRTPLAIMRAKLELLEPRDAEHVVESQAMLMDEVSMMSRLVDDLVVLAKADRPEFVQRSTHDAGALTRAVFDKASTLGAHDWQLGSVAEVAFHADDQRLTQAWLQLAANAVKFSPEGTVIEIGSAVQGEAVALWVRDEGRGIAKADQARVMSRFQRIDSSMDGAGLGLPIVSAICAAHGGELALTSTKGKGSTFTMMIPLTKETLS